MLPHLVIPRDQLKANREAFNFTAWMVTCSYLTHTVKIPADVVVTSLGKNPE